MIELFKTIKLYNTTKWWKWLHVAVYIILAVIVIMSVTVPEENFNNRVLSNRHNLLNQRVMNQNSDNIHNAEYKNPNVKIDNNEICNGLGYKSCSTIY